MKIKVCGMKDAENIANLTKLPIDYMGFIFYSKSPRFVDKTLDISKYKEIDKVGVFVNADKDYIKNKINDYALNAIQLHGNETPDFCKEFENITVIKAFSIANEKDFEATSDFEHCCNYFLFDTKTTQYGGSGQKFNWDILEYYKGARPFFLSGGISAEDVEEIKKINHPRLYALDLNSKFEIEPGLKDINKLEKFINDIQS